MSTRIRISAFLLIVALGGACSSKREPEPSPQAYREAVTAFYTGLAAMQTTQEVLARQKFDRVVALVPQEPAGWANLGLLLLRQQEIEQGAEHLARPRSWRPAARRSSGCWRSPKSRRGNLAEAIGHWRRALELDPGRSEGGLRARARDRAAGRRRTTTPRRSACSSSCVARRDNLAARLEYVRLAAKRGDAAALERRHRAARRRARGVVAGKRRTS